VVRVPVASLKTANELVYRCARPRIPAMKKLLILAVLVAIGVIAARRLRDA
jgi:hypothetical protein